MQQHHHASLSLVSKVSMDANQNLSYTLLTKHRFHKTIVLNYTDILNVWCASVKGWAWVKINSKMITIIMYKLQYIHLVLVSLHIISFGLLCVSLSNNQTHTHKQCTKILLSLTLNLSASLQVQFYSHQHAHARTHTASRTAYQKVCGWWFPHRPVVTMSQGDRAHAHTHRNHRMEILYMHQVTDSTAKMYTYIHFYTQSTYTQRMSSSSTEQAVTILTILTTSTQMR